MVRRPEPHSSRFQRRRCATCGEISALTARRVPLACGPIRRIVVPSSRTTSATILSVIAKETKTCDEIVNGTTRLSVQSANKLGGAGVPKFQKCCSSASTAAAGSATLVPVLVDPDAVIFESRVCGESRFCRRTWGPAIPPPRDRQDGLDHHAVSGLYFRCVAAGN